MRHMVLLFLLIAGGFFAWRYVMSGKEKRITGKWGKRATTAVVLGALVVVGLFAVLSLSSWRLF